MSDPHNRSLTLTKAQIADLAAGFGDASTIEVLREGQHSKVLQTLASIIELSPSEATKSALELLDEAQTLNEQACYDVLTYPHIAVWAWACLQEQIGFTESTSSVRHVDYLGSIAATAAYRCGVENFEITVPLSAGGVVLPGLGRAILTSPETEGEATIASVDGRLSVHFDGREVMVPETEMDEGFDWQAVRTVSVLCNDLRLSVAIDDVDPYRFFYATAALAPPADRLDDVGLKTWQDAIHVAWELLAVHHRGYAEGIAAGLRVIIPMAESAYNNHDRLSESFGAIAVANVSKRWTAYAILEEFQRSKLTALNYLFAVHNVTHEVDSYCLVWHQEPCSFRWLIEYFYALPAIMEFWEVQAQSAALSEDRIVAATVALRWWARADELRNQVHTSRELTRFGTQFFELTKSPKEPVKEFANAAEVRELARFNERDNRVCWRLHNLRPKQEAVARLARAWIAGRPCPADEIEILVSPGEPMVSWLARRWAAIVKMTDPGLFSELKLDAAYLRALNSTLSIADIMLISGLREKATAEYSNQIAESADNLDAWAGLAAACDDVTTLGANVLNRFPEVVSAVYAAIVSIWHQAPGVMELAAWLAPALLAKDPDVFTPPSRQ